MFDPWGYLLRKKAKRAFLGTINYAFRSDQLDWWHWRKCSVSVIRLMVFWCILRINITFGYIIWNWQAYNVVGLQWQCSIIHDDQTFKAWWTLLDLWDAAEAFYSNADWLQISHDYHRSNAKSPSLKFDQSGASKISIFPILPHVLMCIATTGCPNKFEIC